MQSTGQTFTQAVSFVAIQGSAITYAIATLLRRISRAQIIAENASRTKLKRTDLYHQTWHCTSRNSSIENYTTFGTFALARPSRRSGPRLASNVWFSSPAVDHFL